MISELDKNTALVLIDLQNSIVGLALAHPIETILANVNTLIAAFRKKDLPIIAVNVNPSGAAWTRTRKEAKPMAVPNDENWYRISGKVDVQPTDVCVTKHTWNAFFETPLNDELKKRNVTGIVLAGVSTSIGVEGTARAAAERGYNISFAIDAMTDIQETAHERSIRFIFPRMGETGTTKEIVAMLSRH